MKTIHLSCIIYNMTLDIPWRKEHDISSQVLTKLYRNTLIPALEKLLMLTDVQIII